MATAVVVGSGPNGLAAAVCLARHGVRVRVLEAMPTIGGGARSSALTLPGLIHDDCSAVHPAGVASPYLRSLGLEKYGLRWRWPEIDLTHPLDSGAAGVLWRDIRRTARALGPDGGAWMRVFGPLGRDFDDLVEDVFRPIAHWPAHPFTLARFGSRAVAPASWVARTWRRPEARALFAGAAAHAFGSLRAPLSASIGLLLIAAGHAHGWPVAEGGSRSIVGALAALLADLGGTVETGVRVDSLDALDGYDVVLLDMSPLAVTRMAGDRLPGRVARAYRRFRYGPAAYKVDFAVEGGVPWRDEYSGRAGTVHLGGTFEQVAAAEESIVRGRMPERPFVLVGQQYLADPTRSSGDLHPVWAYAHVPHGHPGNATEAIVDQIERFAPGFRERVAARHIRTVARMSAYNPNYVGGDIGTGASSGAQLLVRPRPALDPYATGIPGVFLCSSATPPGPGVHGMCGYNAARSALRHLRRGGGRSR
ncbi:NAD(P)/FAD-dependent oxidoreductase [Thermopolyspora sp. NPDC052614]|uniref:phytoene desaturase family protein n=1 Tax=Thermopolyspora sp. NPDC052614 TaxID=3155682 RepID=UPI00343BA0CF